MFPAISEVRRVADADENFSNRILYQMCADYPRHQNLQEIEGKLWLIGRSYSASLERKKPSGTDTFSLYRAVAQDLMTLDAPIQQLRALSVSHVTNGDHETIRQIFALHRTFTEILYKHTNLYKRSLASKYLHFHLPQRVFIYDSIMKNRIQAIYPAKTG